MKTKKQVASLMLTTKERVSGIPVFNSLAWMNRRKLRNPHVETVNVFRNERVAESEKPNRSGIKKFPNHKW